MSQNVSPIFSPCGLRLRQLLLQMPVGNNAYAIVGSAAVHVHISEMIKAGFAVSGGDRTGDTGRLCVWSGWVFRGPDTNRNCNREGRGAV